MKKTTLYLIAFCMLSFVGFSSCDKSSDGTDPKGNEEIIEGDSEDEVIPSDGILGKWTLLLHHSIGADMPCEGNWLIHTYKESGEVEWHWINQKRTVTNTYSEEKKEVYLAAGKEATLIYSYKIEENKLHLTFKDVKSEKPVLDLMGFEETMIFSR